MFIEKKRSKKKRKRI